jgi:hypothetical protein
MRPPEVLQDLRVELAAVEKAIRSHRYPAAAPPKRSLRAFAGEQYTIVRSDRRSFSHLASRFPEPPAGDFLLGLARGESEALTRLVALAESVGMEEGELAFYAPQPGCQACPAFVSWLGPEWLAGRRGRCARGQSQRLG